MKKRFGIWGALIIFFLAFILHNLYAWTMWGIFKPISAVNESVWEHMKMMFFAGFFYYLFMFVTHRSRDLVAVTASLLTMTATIPMVYYTYTAFFGKGFMIVDILLAFVAALLGEYVGYCISSHNRYSTNSFKTLLAGIVLVAMLVMYVWFTYYPPTTPIFMCYGG